MSLFDKIKQVLKDGGKEHPAQEPLPTPPVKPKNHSREHRTIATTEEPPPPPKAKGSDQGSDEMTLQTLATVDPQEQKSISLRKPKSRTRIGKESHVRAFSKKSKKLNSETTKDSSGVIKDKFTNSIKLPAPAAPSSKTAMKLRGPESLKASRKKKASKVVTEATTETLATVEKPLPRSTKSPGLRKSKMKHKDKKKSSSDYVVDKCSSEKAKRSKLKHQGTKDAEGMSGGKRREKSIYMPPEDAPEGQNSIMKKVEPDSEQNTKFEVLNVAPRPAVSVFIRKKKTLIVRRGAPVDVQDLPPKWKNSMEPLGGKDDPVDVPMTSASATHLKKAESAPTVKVNLKKSDYVLATTKVPIKKATSTPEQQPQIKPRMTTSQIIPKAVVPMKKPVKPKKEAKPVPVKSPAQTSGTSQGRTTEQVSEVSGLEPEIDSDEEKSTSGGTPSTPSTSSTPSTPTPKDFFEDCTQGD